MRIDRKISREHKIEKSYIEKKNKKFYRKSYRNKI